MSESNALDGATTTGEPWAYPSTPGEFAARWNGWDGQQRSRWLALMVENSEKAGRCWQEDHAGQIAWAKRQRPA